MTQEEKQLLLIDLCARLPYGVVVDNPNPAGGAWDEVINIDILEGTVTLLYDGRTYEVEKIRPYLRPMSSMTEEERSDMGKAIQKNYINPNGEIKSSGADNLLMCTARQAEHFIDWLNSHHFDYRGLIEKGLALEAPENMYKNE